MSYFVNPNASISDITGALNYALANLGGSVSSNLSSGQISSGGNTIGYLYQYMNVAFATSFDGVTNFSTTSFTNATYFGLRNTSTTTVSSNPADYVWYQVAGGFGTTKYLWYNVTGGRNIQFSVQTTAPAGYYVEWINDPINLDIVTSTIGVKNNILIIYQWTNGTVPARPTTTSTYTWATNTFTPVPSGWSANLYSDTVAGNILFEIQIPLSVNGSVLTSLLDWTNTSYPIIATSANGINGVTGTRTAVISMYQWAASVPTVFPTGNSTYTWSTGVYTAATNPNGWTITPGYSIAGDILYACDAIFSDNTTSSTSTITWSTSTAYSIGASGINGQRTAVIQLYQWSTSSPSSYPSGTSTYTWATGTYTAPSNLNGWSVTPGAPIPGDILYAIDQIVTDNLTTPTTTVTWSSTTEYAIGLAGTNGSAGSNGLSAIYAYLVQNQSLSPPTFTSTTTGATAPSGWSLTPPTGSYIGQVFWYIFGQYNSSTITINGIAPNTTLWTGPTAASIFQDIESDNWNGSVPPTYGTPSTYGTTGYYISRNTGDVYFNNGIFRGNLQTGSSPAVSGSGVTTTMTGQGAVINVNGSFAIGNSTANIASDGTAVVLNGFVNGTGSSSVLTGITSSNQTVATIIPSKTTKICFGITGEMDLVYQSSVAPYPDYVYATYTFYLYQGSTLVKTYSTSTIMGGGAKFTSSVTGTLLYIGQLSTGFSLIDVLPFTGGSTYTLQINGSRNWYSSTSGVLTPVMTGGALNYFALNGNSFYYQAG